MIKKYLQKNIINRKFCICKNKLKQKINFGNLPLINNYKTKKNLIKYPVIISQCEKCFLIQLKYSVSDKLLFSSNYSYLSGNSREKIYNFETILTEIKKFSKKKNPRILDIGSNDGSFLELVKKKYPKVLGVEPTNTAINSINKGIDIVIANAGIGGDDNILSGNSSEMNKILQINVLGVTNSIVPFIPKMKEQLSGRIAIISSIASFRGIPSHGAYSSSKAAIANLTESWGYTLKSYHISLTTIFPGYIDTEMTKGHQFKMPFLMNSDKASKIIANAIQHKRRKVIFPWQWKFIVPIFRILTRFLIYRFTPNK